MEIIAGAVGRKTVARSGGFQSEVLRAAHTGRDQKKTGTRTGCNPS